MKIVHLSPSLLTLRLRPVWLWIFGGMSVTAGLSVLAIFAQVTTLSCTRIQPTNCQLVASGLLGSQSKEIPLNTLQGAKVEENSNGDGSTYRVVILTSSGEVPFTSYSSSGESEKQAIASHLKNFIGNPMITSLTEKQDDRLWMSLYVIIFIAAGFDVVYKATVVNSVFDKTLDTLTLKRQGLFGTKVIQHRLSEIKDVQVEESTDSDGSTYRVSILLVSGESLPITSYYSSGRTSKQKTASCIKNFLNIND